MPRRNARPCRKAGCAGLTTDRSGYCEKHKNTDWESWQQGKSASQRGYGAAWRRIADAIRLRDGNLCQPCKRAGFLTEAYAVDHITPKSQGGDDSESNLQCICKQCHKEKTAQE